MTDNFKPDMLLLCEIANIKFIPSPELIQACQQFGEVYVQKTSPEKCYATGKCLEVAELGERANAVLHLMDQPFTAQLETLTCELVLNSTGEKVDCHMKHTNANQYEISYRATSRGRHQLHIKVEGEHIKGSPFPITVKLSVQKFGSPIKTIDGVEKPFGVAVNQKGEIIVGEDGACCVSIFSSTGEKIQSFGSQGSGYGQFEGIRGVAVDDDGNIFMIDPKDHRIQKFTSDGKFITAVGKKGNKHLEFDVPRGITIHPLTKKLYIPDYNNHRLQILNPDLTFSSSFGSYGSDNGQFDCPSGVACDSTGHVYVADTNNHCIQVFTAEGGFLRKFGQYGKGNGELLFPVGVSIYNVVYVTEYSNHRVSVFTCEGNFLTSFGSSGSGPGQFSCPSGIAVDNDGVVYVSDASNNRIQLF